MTITQRDRDPGTAYKASTTRTELTSVVRGTPMGELLRRYWHRSASQVTPPISPEKSAYRAREPKRDEMELNRHRALAPCLGMIFSENRFAFFRIML